MDFDPLIDGPEETTLLANVIGSATAEAKAHGLGLALSEQVQIAAGVRVGGEGLEPPTFSV